MIFFFFFFFSFLYILHLTIFSLSELTLEGHMKITDIFNELYLGNFRFLNLCPAGFFKYLKMSGILLCLYS